MSSRIDVKFTDLVDDIQARLREQEEVARMLAALFRVCDAARPQAVMAHEIDELWAGLIVVSDRMGRDLDAVNESVSLCHQLATRGRR
jgi:hypothetical protein